MTLFGEEGGKLTLESQLDAGGTAMKLSSQIFHIVPLNRVITCLS